MFFSFDIIRRNISLQKKGIKYQNSPTVIDCCHLELNSCRYVRKAIGSFWSHWMFLNISLPIFSVPCTWCLTAMWLLMFMPRCHRGRTQSNLNHHEMPFGSCLYSSAISAAMRQKIISPGNDIMTKRANGSINRQCRLLILDSFRPRRWKQNVEIRMNWRSAIVSLELRLDWNDEDENCVSYFS